MEKIVEESNIIYMIVIKHKQSSISNILKEFPNAEIFDVTSKVGAVNEYDFGKGTPDIKFLLNTLKFDESSPYASAFMKKGGKSKLIKRYV